MNRKEFLEGFRKHVKALQEVDKNEFEFWLYGMQYGITTCPFVRCNPNYADSEERKYYKKYHGSFNKNDIACQMVQVYCEVVFEKK